MQVNERGNKKLIINPFAEYDLEYYTEWYDLQKENLGSDFIAEVKSVVKRIQQNPLQYQKVRKTVRKASVKRFPFILVYHVGEEVINIFAVFHTSKNPLIWKNRMRHLC